MTRIATMTWRCCLLIALVALGAALPIAPALAAGESSRVPRPVINAGDGKACVADSAFMRINHMDLLKHQRDDTVHRGIRTAKFSLGGCVNCHASVKTGSVNAGPDDFCRSCHVYAGVTLDCFECHNAQAKAAPGKTTVAPASAHASGTAQGGQR